jgi:hypothetical protein
VIFGKILASGRDFFAFVCLFYYLRILYKIVVIIFYVVKSDLFIEISEFIELSKQTVRVQANSVLTALFWKIGQRIRQEVWPKKELLTGRKLSYPYPKSW